MTLSVALTKTLEKTKFLYEAFYLSEKPALSPCQS